MDSSSIPTKSQEAAPKRYTPQDIQYDIRQAAEMGIQIERVEYVMAHHLDAAIRDRDEARRLAEQRWANYKEMEDARNKFAGELCKAESALAASVARERELEGAIRDALHELDIPRDVQQCARKLRQALHPSSAAPTK